MEILNIAILDDSQSKITRIKTKFSQHNDKETSLYDERYAKYKLNLCQIDVEKSCNEIIAEILKNNFDAIIIDYDFTSFAKTSNNGIIIAKTIEEKFCEYPLFILTAYEERLFENEVFDVYQIYNYDNYINNDEVAKEFHIHIIEQILKCFYPNPEDRTFTGETFEQFANWVVDMLEKADKSILLRIKVVYNNSGYTTLPRYAKYTFIEPMSIVNENKSVIVKLGIDLFEKPIVADQEQANPNPLMNPTVGSESVSSSLDASSDLPF